MKTQPNQRIVYTLLFFLIIIIMQNATAQFPVDGPYQSIAPPPTPALPVLGQTIVDTSVPSPIDITRITEEYHYTDDNGNPQIWYPSHGYSKTQIWNADQTLYKISSWKIYDATNYQEIQHLSGLYPSYWSNKNPDLIWSFRENGDILKYTVSTQTTETFAHISGYEFIKLGPGEGNIDKNDHYVALVGKKDNGAGSYDLDVIVYDLEANQIVTVKNFPNGWADGPDYGPKYIDWVSVSQSGDYVVIMWNHNTATDNGVDEYYENGNIHYGVEVFDTQTMQFQNRIVRYGNHGDLGYAMDGDEVLVQFYGVYGGGTLYMFKLNGSGYTVLSTHPDFGVDGHISCRNLNRPGWAYVTNADAAQNGQLVAVKLDNSGIVEHFGHHFSSNTSYDQSPMAVASPNGDMICFKSDFGTGPNTHPSVVYDFIAKLSNTQTVLEEQSTPVKCFPNPVKDFIEIENKNTIDKINIYNQMGQLLKAINNTSRLKKVRIDLHEFKSGVYILHIYNGKQFWVNKIIKK